MAELNHSGGQSNGMGLHRWVGLVGGPVLGLIVALALPAGLDEPGRAAGGCATWMAIWWLTEAVPLPVTALLPLVLFPLAGIADARHAAAPYANDLIFLFLGGFIVGLGLEKSGLHKRIALMTILAIGVSPRRIVAGFMLASALLSMWVSNTATTIMMLPIAMSVIDLIRAHGDDRPGDQRGGNAKNLGVCLTLGIAYAASIGGIGTLIGTPPNLVLATYLRQERGIDVTMARWMLIGLPVVAVMLPAAWWLLTRILFPVDARPIPGGRALIRRESIQLGPMGRGEWTALIVFLATAMLWVLRPLIVGFGQAHDLVGLAALRDSTIAVAAAVALFVVPVDARSRRFAMDWATASRLPWGILLLFGGGLSLASALDSTGVTAFLGSRFQALAGAPDIVLILLATTLMIFLTELTSNTAVTTTLVPVLMAAALGLGMDNPLLLLIPATLAASCAFMLPVATPPNAIVFGSGRVGIGQMARAGLGLNLIGIVVVTLVGWMLAPLILHG